MRLKGRAAGRLALAGLYVPAAVKKRKLTELARLTARAFDAEPPALDGLPWRVRLATYALFTRQLAEEAIDRQDAAALARRLFEEARPFGQELARELRISDLDTALAAARILYRALGIDLVGDRGGEIVVRRCYFAQLYTHEVCRLMSAVDYGILSGLAGFATLRFEQRLTAGDPCCRARFELEAQS